MSHTTTTRVLLSALCIFLLCSCSSHAATPPPVPTETTAPTVPALPSETPLPTDTPTPAPTPTPDLARAKYVMDLRLDYTTSIGSVTQTITYPNWTGETLNDLVLAVQPNFWQGGFTIKSLSIDNQSVSNYTLDGQKLTVPLPQPLPSSGTLTLAMEYRLVLPKMQAYTNPDEVRPQIYGYSDRQTNLVDWYPFIVPYKSGEG